MSLFTRLKNIFRVQSHEAQIFIISIGLFVLQVFTYSIGRSLIRTLVEVAITGLVSYLIIKIFDKNGNYSMYTIWKVLLVIYGAYYLFTAIF